MTLLPNRISQVEIKDDPRQNIDLNIAYHKQEVHVVTFATDKNPYITFYLHKIGKMEEGMINQYIQTVNKANEGGSFFPVHCLTLLPSASIEEEPKRKLFKDLVISNEDEHLGFKSKKILFIFPQRTPMATEFINQFLEVIANIENPKLQEVEYYFDNEEGDK
ncbi:MAG: hypothetical protein ACK4UP_11950 [Spirosomataceae bacterium]